MVARLFVAVLVVALLGASAFAVGNIGTPTAELKQGQWSLGGDYAYSDFDFDIDKIKWTTSEGGSATDEFDIADVKTNFYYVTFGYGLADNWEVYGRLGIADIKGETDYDGDKYGANFDNDLVWGVGTRCTFHEKDKVRWGATAQINWIDTSVEWKGSDWKDTLDFSAYDLLVAVGPTVDMGGWKLYGGPFFYMIDGDVDEKYTEWGEGTYWEKGKADVEEDSSFGGYVGAAIPIAENMDMTFEVAAISGGWAAGTGVVWTF